MTKKSDAPAIRFKGFSDAWEQRKLGEIGSVSMCRRIFKEQTSETGDIPFYKIGTFGAEPDAFISRELFEEYKSKYPYPKKGDILISASGSIGRTVEFAGNNEYFQDSNIVWLSHDERLSNSFLKCFYSVVKWAGIEGSTIKRLYNDNILNTVICMPSVPEQEHIGLFFENLDNLITLHQRKFEKLTNVKKSMLEKMFPQNGSSYPEIRFKGFTDPWEQRKFFELYEMVSRKNDLTYGRNDIISVANMYFKPDSYITDDSYLLTYNIFELGDIAFEGNKSKNYAHGRFVENTIGNGIVSHVFDVFKPIMNPYDLLFWKYAINNERLMGSVLLRSTKASTMMTNLVATDFLQESFLVPTYPEQQKIGAFFSQFDDLITLHQRELEKLQSIKKSLLEKMFV